MVRKFGGEKKKDDIAMVVYEYQYIVILLQYRVYNVQ